MMIPIAIGRMMNFSTLIFNVLFFIILNKMKQHIVQEKSFAFAVRSIDLYKLLLASNEYVLSKQFFRSATSIGANVGEAIAAYSKREFASKMSISSKGARETFYWLKLMEAGRFVDYDVSELKEESQQLMRILSSIVKTSQDNR